MVYDYGDEFDEISMQQVAYFIDHSAASPTDIAVHIYVHTMNEHYPGTYIYRFYNHTFYESLIPHTSKAVNVSSAQTLTAFIVNATTLDRAEHNLFVFAGHGWGWFLLPSTEETPLPFPMIRQCFEKAKIHLDLLVIDGCLQANLESMYEIQSITDYVWALEDYDYDDGLFDPKAFLTILESFPFNIHSIVDELMKDFIHRFHLVAEDNSTDSALLDIRPSKLFPLVAFISEIAVWDTEFPIHARVDPDYQGLYDVYSTITSLPRVKDNPLTKTIFEKLFSEVVIEYKNTDTPISSLSPSLSLSRSLSRSLSHSPSRSPSLSSSPSPLPLSFYSTQRPLPSSLLPWLQHSKKLKDASPYHHGLSFVRDLGPPADSCWSICYYLPLKLSRLIRRAIPWIECTCSDNN
eukprot:TRINITY_DN1261_c0_g1_i1.p1 TRINITY_DN1261_c0_g1~~TRINITY_DN1261_c0_g1_i1.p1  ORF type:complete len:406 (-),score=83.67 TRINITY_DN1261_c0_g1_i1:2-1219(-)